MVSHHFKRACLSRCLSSPRYPLPANQSGFSFLELLISLLIFAIGFLGLAALQNLSFKMTHDSVLQASAVSLSSSLVDQLRVKGNTFDLSQWKTLISKELPNGNLALTKQGSQYQLKLQWQESQHSEDPSNNQHYEVKFRLNE
tara:strand:+ start:12018 stop:12446 length:429 start_codon:yes stop_codon:yes gene_type:complete